MSLVEHQAGAGRDRGGDAGRCVDLANRRHPLMLDRAASGGNDQLGSGDQGIMPKPHGGGSGVRRLPFVPHAMALHAKYTVDDAQSETSILQHRTLLDV